MRFIVNGRYMCLQVSVSVNLLSWTFANFQQTGSQAHKYQILLLHISGLGKILRLPFTKGSDDFLSSLAQVWALS